MLFTSSISGLTRILHNVDLKQYSQSLAQAGTKRECKLLIHQAYKVMEGRKKKTLPERKLIKS